MLALVFRLSLHFFRIVCQLPILKLALFELVTTLGCSGFEVNLFWSDNPCNVSLVTVTYSQYGFKIAIWSFSGLYVDLNVVTQFTHISMIMVAC